MRKYEPKPLDTSDVELSSEILNLTEELAEQIHEIWAEGRLSQCWSHGETRDDARRQTPCLVSYDSLPEIEKEYDRNTAIATLKLIIKLGYKTEKI